VRPQVPDRCNYVWKVNYDKCVLNNQSQTPDSLMAGGKQQNVVRNDIFKLDGSCGTIYATVNANETENMECQRSTLVELIANTAPPPKKINDI